MTIKNEKEAEQAYKRIEKLMAGEPAKGSKDGSELDELVAAVEAFEKLQAPKSPGKDVPAVQDPAFPCVIVEGFAQKFNHGVSKRLWVATPIAAALAGKEADPAKLKAVAGTALALADELIKLDA